MELWNFSAPRFLLLEQLHVYRLQQEKSKVHDNFLNIIVMEQLYLLEFKKQISPVHFLKHTGLGQEQYHFFSSMSGTKKEVLMSSVHHFSNKPMHFFPYSSCSLSLWTGFLKQSLPFLDITEFSFLRICLSFGWYAFLIIL